MALTRKMLKAMGIEEEKIDQIIDAHTETVDALKSERDKLKEEAGKLPGVQKELDDLKAAKDSGGSFEEKYKALKEEFDSYKKDVEQKETTGKKEAAYRALLKEVGVSEKRLDAVMRVTTLDKLKLDKEGKLEDADKLKESIKEEWADFIVKQGKKGADVTNPPDGDGKSYKDKKEIMAIKDAAERQKAIAENMNLFTGKGE